MKEYFVVVWQLLLAIPFIVFWELAFFCAFAALGDRKEAFKVMGE